MKIKITLKDPDGFWDGVSNAVQAEVQKLDGLRFSERVSLAETRRDSILEYLSTWVEHSEYITIEFDTEAKTATVLPL